MYPHISALTAEWMRWPNALQKHITISVLQFCLCVFKLIILYLAQKKKKKGLAQVVERLPSNREDWVQSQVPLKQKKVIILSVILVSGFLKHGSILGTQLDKWAYLRSLVKIPIARPLLHTHWVRKSGEGPGMCILAIFWDDHLQTEDWKLMP
jgi:hypothetical protein